MYYSSILGQLGKKKNVKEYNSIPKINEVDVIKYDNEEGMTKYKLSVYELGDRFIFEENLLEEIFTEYLLDGNYERESLESLMPVEDMMKYDYARNNHLRKDCNQILSRTLNKLNSQAKKQGRAYTLR